MLPRQRAIAVLPNSWEQMQGCYQNRETEKRGPNERTDQNSRKRANEMEISNLSDPEFKTLVIRMLKELSEDPSSIKKIQSEMKYSLIEIKNNL